MMNCKRQILVVAAALMAPVAASAENSQDSTKPIQDRVESPVATGENGSYLFPDRDGGFLDGSPYLVRGQSPLWQETVARFGWWAVDAQGSPSGVGEWTSLNSTAFWDVDGLASDGTSTIDFAFSGPMDETTDLRGYYFGPALTAEIDVQRFIHRYGYKPLEAWFETPTVPLFRGENFNETMDHAIRVQELDAKFSGDLAPNVKWHLNLWGMRKFGERQKMSLDHGFGCVGAARACHQVTQSQSIDWLTMEVQPGVEVKMGPLTAEYTRTMRSFGQDDEVVTRSYVGHPNLTTPGVQYPYGVVPENYTEIDKIKIGADLSENNRFYANLFRGNTHNHYRDTDRGFWGTDLRLTNTTFDNLRLTGHAKHYEQNGDLPTFHPEESQFPTVSLEDQVRHPVNRQWTTVGLKGRWTPFQDLYRWRGLAFTSGYQYQELERQFVTYPIIGPPGQPASFTQPDTITHDLHVGTDMRWSASFDTYLRYRMVTTDDPLFGVREADRNVTQTEIDSGFTTSGVTALNTSLPTQQDRIEFGGNWLPAHNFMLGAAIGIETTNHRSSFARFDEDNYPITLTAWYAPTERWSLSGVLGFYSSWIDQDITFGTGYTNEPLDNLPADYTGRSDVVTLASHYALTSRLKFIGDFQFVRGQNTWFVPSPPGADFSTLPGFSAVVIETTRFGAGLDYELGHNSSCFFKYMFYDYNDKAGDVFSGSYHMLLGGMAARF